MNAAHLLLALAWILFCGLHSLFAGLRWKAWMQVKMGGHFRYYRLYYTVFAFLSLGLVVAYQLQIDSPLLLQGSQWLRAAGIATTLAGLLIMAVCIRKYFMHLSGLKSLYLNDDQAANQLQITGIHRYVRHPLYSGTFLAIWGLWLLFPTLALLIANFVITGYTLLAIRWEEQKLVQEFGDAYRQYRRQVPKLVPLPGKSMQ